MDSDDAEILRADFPELLEGCRSVHVTSDPGKMGKLSELLARLDGDLSCRERRLVFVWSMPGRQSLPGCAIEEVNGRLRVTMGRRNASGVMAQPGRLCLAGIDRVRQDIAMSKSARAVRAAEEAWIQEARMMHVVA
ncbi:hypothetical protein [Azospirillum sp. TSO5]|uniref:hypothetical protein n=1 Tax=Azospirillum sp. TSO5 TaxID=716760 RepID=UPI000D620C64|nr:hypothetical protein [Azospirillum sp. TSO5]PWC92981.1 hypothetical protein TSO5_16280 [Azospirillum sp. TSO5]